MWSMIVKAALAVKNLAVKAVEKVAEVVTKPVAAVATGGLALAGQAQAALPEGITTAITGATGDLASAATAIIVGMLAFWGLRKLGQKMGWW